MGEDGWTTVRYRRGRLNRRPQYYDWGYGAGTARGKDRAPPVPYGGQAPFPPPNLPVPPAGRNWRRGPRTQSYADVVRGRHAWASRPFTNPSRGQPMRQQPTDPAFGQLVRKLHALIKMVHHLQNVAPKPGKEEPRMISRMVEILGSMIKPASPTVKTIDLIWGNAKNWGYCTLLVLEQHYTEGLEKMLGEIEGLLTPDWRTAFEVATRWARRNLSRISQDVIDHAEALITTRGDPNKDKGVQGEIHNPPDGSAGVAQVVPQTRDAQLQTTLTQLTQNAPSHSTSTGHVLVQTSPPAVPAEQSSSQHSHSVSVGTMTGDGEQSTQDSDLVTPRAATGLARDWLISPSPSPDLLDMRDDEDASPILFPDQPSTQQSQPGPSESGFSDLVHSTPRTQRLRVTCHPNSLRKMIDWDLQVHKKWLILGDSNLARISGHHIQDLQIDSYPGANFRHAQALISKATSHVMVEKLVLSFGINSRGQKAKETAVKQAQAAVRTAKKKFPHAEIWIPVINFSTSLPVAERTTLRILNAHIKRNLPFIPALPGSVFRTERDEIHWCRNTARAMLDHWLTFLNWTSPQAS